MKILKKNISFIIIMLVLLIVGVISYSLYYVNIYLLSFNGKIENITKDIKEDMIITISNKQHNIAHYWPKFQKYVEIGDSVHKNAREYNIILIKKVTKKRIVCKYNE